MLEVVSDLTVLWISVVVTVLLIAAFTNASMSGFEWIIKTNWKQQFHQVEVNEKVSAPCVRPMSAMYRPKIPAVIDKRNLDDEDVFPPILTAANN